MFDSTKETLSVFINGVLCGIMADRLNDKYCWGIVLKQKGSVDVNYNINTQGEQSSTKTIFYLP